MPSEDSNVCASQCMGQAEKAPCLTEQVAGRFETLCIQTQTFKDMVSKMRDVLGVYNAPSQLGGATPPTNAGQPEPVSPTISDVARKMKHLIDKNENILNDFENLLRNI